MRWLFFAPLRRFVLLAGGASLLLNLALLVPALYMLQVFDRVFASRSVETLAMLSLLAALALWLAGSMDAARGRALAWAGGALESRLSPLALEHALQRAAAGRGAAADNDRLRDIRQLRQFLASSAVQALFDAPWLPIYLGVISLLHPVLGLAAALGAVTLMLLAVLTERLTRGATAATLLASRRVGRQAEALTRHAEVIVAMGMSAAALASWRTQHAALLDTQARLTGVSTRLGALARASRQGVQLMVLGVGAWLVVGADASPGIMVAATILLGRALQPVEQLIGGWKQLLDARGAWQRLAAAQTAAVAALEPGQAQPLSLAPPRGRLDLERVVYAPEAGRPALIKAVSFSVDAGESLGIIGPSAAGKTSLLRLLLGLRQPHSGCVRFGGADVTQWNRDEFGAHVGYLPQDVSLFEGTVAQNIARCGPVDDARVVEAAERAQAHMMILRLPQGYDTPVGEGGTRLSGGQRQRIGLARALYGAPRLVVLDEPNAHLDADGDAALKHVLLTLKTSGTTVIVVGHRPGLMAQLDKLAVLKDGALEAFGPAPAVLARLAGAQAQPVRVLPTRSEVRSEAHSEVLQGAVA